MYFFLSCFLLICSAEIIKKMYVNQDLKFAIKYIDELQKNRACTRGPYLYVRENPQLVKKACNDRIKKVGEKTSEESYSSVRDKNQ